MWRINKCGCNPIINEPFEFQILGQHLGYFNNNIQELFPIIHDINELKRKVICEYIGIIDKLECGTQPDLEFLLEEISLIDILENG